MNQLSSCAALKRAACSQVPLSSCSRAYATISPPDNPISFRQNFKNEAKRRKALERERDRKPRESLLRDWELTIGLEIHAQLNTTRKLFSDAQQSTVTNDEPNSHNAIFDLSIPGSQPRAVVLPAIRAALALNCSIQRLSRFDRKHYFYQDQPSGYQITQYYAPFAKAGFIKLFQYDDIDPLDGESIEIGIKQIQLEQDTAKTIQQSPNESLLDFNRAGHPLIEIITLPQIHHARTAAACVSKIQKTLEAVSSVTTGMELGGLRADVNVSVRRRGSTAGPHSYHGIAGLGQRTEIKNLSSVQAVEDAIAAEQDRQIDLLNAGGIVEGETRAWTLGGTETKRLRGKEGEVDYRYMPDPDIPPLFISSDLIEHLRETLPMLPDEQVHALIKEYGLKRKDAKILVALDGGRRADYFLAIVNRMMTRLDRNVDAKESGRLAANWMIHELGGLLASASATFEDNTVAAESLADIIGLVVSGKITGTTAKVILSMIFNGDSRHVLEITEQDGLEIKQLTDLEYSEIAARLVLEHPEMADKVRRGQAGKLKWFIGQFMQQGDGRVDAQKATVALQSHLRS